MKTIKHRFVVIFLIFIGIFAPLDAKPSSFLNTLCDQEAVAVQNPPENSDFLCIKDHGSYEDNCPQETQELFITECERLKLLFDDAVATEVLFHSKTDKYYRGQIEQDGFEYLDNCRFDEAVTPELIASMTVDPRNLSELEKSNLNTYYRLIKQKYESPWYMKYISKKVGYGVFAAADIKKGQLIAEYVGIIYDKATYLKRVPYNANYCWSMIPHSSLSTEVQFYVDAIKSCNFTRFINHSYTPNVMPLPLYTPEGYRMLYVACEDIAKDEQLLVNYGQGYWANRTDHEELSR